MIVSRSVAVGGGVGGADGWGDEPTPALRVVSPQPVSAKARARGLFTVADVKREMLLQRATWWQGRKYHCPLCDVNFGAAQLAAEHVVRVQHPVLRMD